MDLASDLIELLLGVLPAVENDAKKQLETGTQYRGFYIGLRLQITIFKLQLSNLQPMVEESRSKAIKCMPHLRTMLQFFEKAYYHPLYHAGSESRLEQFPKLEDIRDRIQIPSEAELRYDLDKGEDILESFDDWMEALSESSKDMTPRATKDQNKPKRPSNAVRESSEILKKAVDNLRSCCRATSHDCMLFLATQHHVRDSHPYVVFDLLYKTEESQTDHWHESKVHVMLHEDKNRKVQFSLHDTTVPDAPRKRDRRHPIRGLCAYVKANNGPSMCLNMRLEDSHLYKTTSSTSNINALRLGPHETLRNIIKGKSIISTTSKIKLAVLAAYTVLHFSGSPWLPPGWDKTYFYLLKSPFERSPMLRPLLAVCEHLKSQKTTQVPGKHHKHPDLLQLGVLLLEIFLKQPIEQLIEKRDSTMTDQSDADTTYFTADRKWDEIYWDVHEGFEEAVDACLSTDIDVPSPPYDNHEERELYANRYCAYIYERIILPLEGELEALCKIGPGDLDKEIRDMKTRNKQNDSTQTWEPHTGTVALNAHVTPLKLKTEQPTRVSIGSSSSDLYEPGEQNCGRNFSSIASHTLLDDDDHEPSRYNQLCNSADKWLQRYSATLDPSRHPFLYRDPRNADGKVRVAILGSGINEYDEDIGAERSRVTYRDFLNSNDEPPCDLIGHGTHAAALLLNIAPNVDVYIARVIENRHKVCPSAIAKAIRYAASPDLEKWNVDIICVPFAFGTLTPELQCVQDAILYAYSQNKVIFAAASNRSSFHKVACPASRPEVICVNSGDGSGRITNDTLSMDGVGFVSVVGEAVPSSWSRFHSPRKSGSSIATPIAAGIGAAVMSYIRERKTAWKRSEDVYLASRIGDKIGMLAVLRNLMSDSGDATNFLRPWVLFERSPKVIDELVLDTLRHAER